MDYVLISGLLSIPAVLLLGALTRSVIAENDAARVPARIPVSPPRRRG